MTKAIVILSALLVSLVRTAPLEEDIIVTLPNGKVQGASYVTSSNKTYYGFRGIPYAFPPVGDLRFELPKPITPWNGIWNATTDSKICISTAYLDQPERESEDCLYVNVYMPTLQSKEKLPVMFWIYGGGFNEGSSDKSLYGPDYLIEEDVIVVSFNYRLGPFGFLSTGDKVLPGNLGLKDQSLALKWTYENIEYFGGDPEKIMIFGQSAGGVSTGLHLVSKQSAGLFRAAIVESGSATVWWAVEEDPKTKAYLIADAIPGGNYGSDTQALKDFLKNRTVEEIIKARMPSIYKRICPQRGMWTEANLLAAIQAVRNGELGTNAASRTLRRKLKSTDSKKGKMGPDSILGAENEKKLVAHIIKLQNHGFAPRRIDLRQMAYRFAVALNIPHKFKNELAGKDWLRCFLRRNPELSVRKAEDLDNTKKLARDCDTVPASTLPINLKPNSTDQDAVVKAIRNIYLKEGETFSSNLVAFADYFTDNTFARGIIKHAELASQFVPVHFYQFAYFGRTYLKPFIDGAEKASHSAELPFLFNMEGLNKDTNPEDMLIQNRMVKLWTNFAKYLDPTPEKSDLFDNLVWPAFDKKNFSYLNINNTMEVRDNIKGNSYPKWIEIFETYGRKPFITF